MAVEGAGAALAAHQTGRVIARLSRWVESTLAELDLSLPQYRVLVLLADGSAAAKALARGLEVSPPSVTAVVDGLVARGLVARNRSDSDRRRVDHVLTAAGRRTLARAEAAISARLDGLAAHLGPEQVAAAHAGLAAWSDALDAERAEIVREHDLA
jgi:long-chain acyl-CoA synthetase